MNQYFLKWLIPLNFCNPRNLILAIFVSVILTVGVVFVINNYAQNLAPDSAVTLIRNREEVKEFLTEVPGGKVEIDGPIDTNFYSVHVYEIKDGHTATFNWYQVDKKTGEIKAEFDMTK